MLTHLAKIRAVVAVIVIALLLVIVFRVPGALPLSGTSNDPSCLQASLMRSAGDSKDRVNMGRALTSLMASLRLVFEDVIRSGSYSR